jgi:hypothetical protein
MNAAAATILASVLSVGALTLGAIWRLSYKQGVFHGAMTEFMTATLRRLKRLEDQDDLRTNGRR